MTGRTLRMRTGALALGALAAVSAAGALAADYALDRQDMRAQLIPQRYTTLSAEVGAKISRIPIKEGQRFVAGQTLVALDCILPSAQLQKARAQQASARNNWEGSQQMAKLNAIGQVELRNSEAEVAKAAADVAYLQATIDKCQIKAPFSGRAGEQKAREQQFVQPGQAILEIVDDSTLELELIVPTRWLAWFRPGHKFQVHIEDTDKTYPVKLVRITAKADPVSQSVKSVAVIDGRFPELMAGMSGTIVLAPPKTSR
ncbi:efflux RND transporter periplasmic adaptor subunit [Hydrogenophaga taeniospiralis]|uniref:efflux RND transporter periplasmic adaptor subunit n=1 Tax=Hydrogenophaga taeniospiralis TaxID=65656 RepID=UPI001CFAE3D9|nr:efflux RND transporter periplasmic adaptor subunit [Hydrogenophaga taeniospiralis]